jgi:hypothetical protein
MATRNSEVRSKRTRPQSQAGQRVDRYPNRQRHIQQKRARKPKRWRVADLIRLHPSQLPEPTSDLEKLEWIEFRGIPDYDNREPIEGMLPDGRRTLTDRVRDLATDRLEIQNVYKAVFKESDAPDRRKVLRRYTANFPHLAFDMNSWLWPLWQEWRARRAQADQRNLKALAAGIRARGGAWMSQERFRAWVLAGAKNAVRDLTSDAGLKRAYHCFLDGQKPDATASVENVRPGQDVLRLVQAKTGHSCSIHELQKYKLSGVLRRIVAKQYNVRERDLH